MSEDTGNGSRKAHERMWVVIEQEKKLRLCIRSIREVCTEYELIGIMGRVVGQWLNDIAKYGIRRERHGDDAIPGDLQGRENGA